MELSCIIIDDEFHAQIELTDALKKIPSISLKGVFESIPNSLHYLEGNKIDIVFSDINMPDQNGIEAAAILQRYCRYLIYVTAHREYAIEAFQANAIGYLLKPLSQSSLIEKISLIKEWSKNESDLPKKITDDFVFVKGSSKNSFIKLELSHIIYIEAMLNYVKIWINNAFHITYATLKSMEQKLYGKSNFIRVSKSIIINTNHIIEVDGFYVKMTDGNKFSIGESYKNAFILFLNKRTLGG